MKPKRLDELKVLLSSEPFLAWWRDLEQARKTRAEVNDRYERLLEEANVMEFRAELAQKNAIDTVYLAGDAEDEGARFLAEATEIENRSMEAVGGYEEQRFRASDDWIRLGAVERTIEELKERRAKASAKGEAGRSEVDRVDAEIKRQEREHRAAYEVYERTSARKTRLWAEVETLWSRSMDLTLGASEKQVIAQRVKREAERLFALAEEAKVKARSLHEQAEAIASNRGELDAAVSALLRQARETFEATVYESFLYWGQRGNDRLAYCVALVDDESSYNLPVQALTVYQVSAADGVGHIEPLGPERIDVTEGDRRVEDFFLEGRSGRADRAVGGD